MVKGRVRESLPTSDAGALRQFAKYAEASGLALDRILDGDLREAVAQSLVDETVPANAIIDALQLSSTVSGRSDVGVSFAQWTDMHAYGPISLLWDHAPNLSEAVRVNEAYAKMESSAISVSVDDEGEEAAIRFDLLVPARYGSAQFMEGVLFLSVRVVRLMLGAEWTPVRIEFEHASPDELRQHRRLFGCKLEYSGGRNAMIIRKSDLDVRSKKENERMFRFVENQIRNQIPATDNLIEIVDRAIIKNIRTGKISADDIADYISVGRRTFQRRMRDEGFSLRERIEIARRNIATNYLSSGNKVDLNTLSFYLGYSDASAASRFLRKKMGRGSREMRASHDSASGGDDT